MIDDILSSFDSHIVDIQPHLFNNYLLQYAKEQKKNVIYYMYTGEQEISISFRQLSNHPVFAEDCVFLGMKDPPYEIFKGLNEKMLPSIGLIPKLDDDFKEGNLE